MLFAPPLHCPRLAAAIWFRGSLALESAIIPDEKVNDCLSGNKVAGCYFLLPKME
jgi:hypothetical protein